MSLCTAPKWFIDAAFQHKSPSSSTQVSFILGKISNLGKCKTRATATGVDTVENIGQSEAYEQ